MKVEWATSKDVFDYLFDLWAEKFLSEKGKKYLHELFEKWDPEHLENDEDYNNGLEDNIIDEDMQNLEDYYSYHFEKLQHQLVIACQS